MSLITRCPACATMFKVVPDQLRVSEGWVRCGQCSEVFDANANLQTNAVAPVADPPKEVLTQPAVLLDFPEPAGESRVEPDVEPFLTEAPTALDGGKSVLVDVPQEPQLDHDHLADDKTATDENPLNSEATPNDDVLHHAFLRPSTQPVPAGRRSVRIVLALLSVLLAALLVMQLMIRERDWMVSMEPATGSVLGPMCQWIGCEIRPLRRIESVVIDSSSFTKVRLDAYRLSFTLKNTSPLVLATPALELTLTNLQDQPVVRKVFVPADFGDSRGVMEPGSELPVNLPLAIKLGSNSEKISGYRLLSFYP